MVLAEFLVFPICIRKVLETFPDCTRACRFRRNSSNFVGCTQYSNFGSTEIVDQSSNFLKTCVMYSSLILGVFLSLEILFLRCSSWLSLLTEANALLLLNVARGQKSTVLKIELGLLTFNYQLKPTGQIRNDSLLVLVQILSHSVFSLYLSFYGKFFTRQVEVENREKYFKFIIYKAKNANSGGKWRLLHQIPSSMAASFPYFNRKWMDLIHRNEYSYSRANILFTNENSWSKTFDILKTTKTIHKSNFENKNNLETRNGHKQKRMPIYWKVIARTWWELGTLLVCSLFQLVPYGSFLCLIVALSEQCDVAVGRSE